MIMYYNNDNNDNDNDNDNDDNSMVIIKGTGRVRW